MLEQELAAVSVDLAGRSIEELAHAPRMTSPEHPAMLELLMNLFFGAYNSSVQTLANLAIVKMVTLSLRCAIASSCCATARTRVSRRATR